MNNQDIVNTISISTVPKGDFDDIKECQECGVKREPFPKSSLLDGKIVCSQCFNKILVRPKVFQWRDFFD